jgi:hypothetical protein
MRRFYLLLLFALAIGGGVVALVIGHAAYNESKAIVVPLEDVPEPFVQKARETLPDIRFDHARKLPNGNYEIRGKTKNGKVREVELSPSGEVVEIE